MLIGRSSLENVRSSKLLPGEVSEWLMVPLSKSGRRKPRGFESHPLRQSLPRARAAPRRGGDHRLRWRGDDRVLGGMGVTARPRTGGIADDRLPPVEGSLTHEGT